MPIVKHLFTLLIGCWALTAAAQKKNEAFEYPIRRAASPVTVDGRADEPAWQGAAVASDFYMVLPMDTARANVRTDVRMCYDDKHLYFVVECFEKLPGPMFVESLKRDFSFGKNDNFLLFIDPFDDQTNGFSFGANAAGAQWDGQMYEGASVNLNWDNKWTSVVKHYGDRWVFEAAVPFKTLRYKKGITRWGINFSRLDLKTTEKSAWAPVPRQFPTASLAYTGVLVWDVPPPDPGPNISLIPYALAGVAANQAAGTPSNFRRDVGMDAKIAVTSSLNLDLTVNPDFSQVEVDRQQTNLDRFELFFPERRQFFLENGDLFTNVGFATIRPFFSRRIGLGVPIRFGARLSGKLNKDWRIGLLDMQTGAVESTGLPAQNFAVLSLQRRVFARSNIGAIFINKESLNYTPEEGKPLYTSFNRNLGLEYNLASPNNVWRGKLLALKSFSPGVRGDDYVQAANLTYASRHWLWQWQHEYVGKNYTAEVGYVPRRGYFKVNPQVGYLWLPTPGSKVLSHGPQLSTTLFWDKTGRVSDHETYFAYGVKWRNQNLLNVWVATDYIRLLAPFDPTNLGRDTLATGSRHFWNAVGTDFTSKPQSLFTYAFSARFGGYYAGGSRVGLSGEVGYRFQPYVSLGLTAAYNDIRLPEPLQNARFWLIGPRTEVTFTNKLYWTTFVQYNEQIQNINLNTRLQWRYSPASDLYVVYTDNYLPAPFSVKNRALVLKLTYWWNI
jgi:hypothetical protein